MLQKRLKSYNFRRIIHLDKHRSIFLCYTT
mgnify:CR=1 FL=1